MKKSFSLLPLDFKEGGYTEILPLHPVELVVSSVTLGTSPFKNLSLIMWICSMGEQRMEFELRFGATSVGLVHMLSPALCIYPPESISLHVCLFTCPAVALTPDTLAEAPHSSLRLVMSEECFIQRGPCWYGAGFMSPCSVVTSGNGELLYTAFK